MARREPSKIAQISKVSRPATAPATPPATATDEPDEKRSARKRRAILDAATEVFLKSGYLGTNMDDIAALSAVSKQTVYKNFASKEVLFVEIVTRMTSAAGDEVHEAQPALAGGGDLAEYLRAYALRQLSIVLTPRLMQLRRLVIGEVGRFPDLARVLYERGPQRAIATLAGIFEELADLGLLSFDNSAVAASHFNWLIMSAPLNQVMLLGDGAIPKPIELREHVAEAVRVFLAAYGGAHGA
jgi:TetR/AcrR family transcriptional regulator, mexJK operon transcriptional repressor